MAIVVARRFEAEAPIVVLLTVLRAGVPIMRLDGKSRVKHRSHPPFQ